MTDVATTLAAESGALPVGATGARSLGWYGLLTLVASEAALFGYLLFSYGYTASQQPPGFGPAELPSLRLAGPNTLLLVASSFVVAWSERRIRSGRGHRSGAAGLAVTAALGAVFVAIQLLEWRNKGFSLSSDLYGSLYFTITGFHLAHVVAGLVALLVLTAWTLLGYFDEHRHAPAPIVAAYWHFVDVVWLLVFGVFYLVPRLG